MKISPQNSFRLSVILGLSAIVLLVVVLAAVGLWRMAESNRQVEQLAGPGTSKTAIVHRMKDALREQQAATRLALNIADAARQQDELHNASQHAAAVAAARAELESLPLSPDEREILARVQEQARRLQPLVAEAVDQAPPGKTGKTARAVRTLEPEIASAQQQLVAELDRLLALQKRETEAVVSDSRKVFEFTRLHMLILASLAIGAGLMIAPVVIRRANRQADSRQQQAMFDDQTQLPNRLLLIDRLHQAVLSARHEQRSFGLLRIDVDRFKAINGRFGTAVGDQVLQYIAACIQACLNEPDTLARLEGDEFAVVTMAVRGPEEAIVLARRIRQSIHEPLEIAGRQLDLSASIGIALFPHHGEDPAALMSAAGEALDVARQSPRGFRIFSADMAVGKEDQLALIYELRQATAQNELTLHYQPKIDIGADRVSGAEALVRWQHPVHGLMAPEQFIPLAEQIGLIQPLTDWVLDAAMRQVQAWQQAGMHLPMSVKVTASTIQDPEFPQQMAVRLKRYAIPPEYFEIEIKETATITAPQQALECLRQLKELGLPIAIGDFGTGDSSMLFLTEYLIANIKLDKALVQSMAENRGGAMAVRTAVNLGRTLGLQVVAKGVENQDSWNVLRGFGCNAAQGYYLSGPLPPVELVDWLQTSHWGMTARNA